MSGRGQAGCGPPSLLTRFAEKLWRVECVNVGLGAKEAILGREPDRELCRGVNCGDRLTKVGPLVKAYILIGKIPKTRNPTGWLDLHEKSMA